MEISMWRKIQFDLGNDELNNVAQNKLLNQERDEQFRLRLEVEEERDMLADENKNFASFLYKNGFTHPQVEDIACWGMCSAIEEEKE